ncbi:MAG: serine hydrolase domain-containing protein [Victivallaceae bacterium]
MNLSRIEAKNHNSANRCNANAENSAEIFPSYKSLIENNIACGMFYGMEITAGNKKNVFIHEAFGSSRPGTPWELDSIVDMASVTKVAATCSAVMKCVEQGLIDIQAPLKTYLPDARYAGEISLTELATHTSGFENGKQYLHLLRDKHVDIVSAVLAEKPVHPPGNRFCYACINMILLGFAVEAVTHCRLDEFCHRFIFSPLGMNNTKFGPPTHSDQRLVKMTDADLGQISDETARYAGRPIGNAGLFSTASDLAKFCRMLLCNGQLKDRMFFTSKTVRLFSKKLTAKHLPDRSFGWYLEPDYRPVNLSDKTFYHSGWTGQSIFVDPERDLFVIVLSNRRNYPGEPRLIRTRIVDKLVEYIFKQVS